MQTISVCSDKLALYTGTHLTLFTGLGLCWKLGFMLFQAQGWWTIAALHSIPYPCECQRAWKPISTFDILRGISLYGFIKPLTGL